MIQWWSRMKQKSQFGKKKQKQIGNYVMRLNTPKTHVKHISIIALLMDSEKMESFL